MFSRNATLEATISSSYKLISPDTAAGTKDLLDDKNSEEATRRIQALLADWLRMENVVVLTAAGCSVQAGGRLMAGPASNNLECLVLDAVEKCKLSSNESKIVSWKKANGYGSGDFENWLSYLFNASELVANAQSPIHQVSWKELALPAMPSTGFNPTADELKNLCQFIEKAIYSECALTLNKKELTDPSVKTSGHIPFLSKLIARDTNLGRTHLFTLNYDTLFEQALEELGIQYFDGFSGKAASRFDPSVYGLDIYYPGDVAEGKVRRFNKFLQFYKLHGSIHWIFDDGVYRAQHRDLSFAQDYRIGTVDEKAEFLQSEQFKKIGSFGILPTSQKFSQTLDMPFSHLFRLLHARLNQPQTFLLVMGYGFGDEHVTRIIETALMNPSLIMLVVEPNPAGEIVKRIEKYQALGQRAFVLTENDPKGGCSYTKATFADFAQNIMPDVKWLDDYKNLRRFEDQIKKTHDTGTP